MEASGGKTSEGFTVGARVAVEYGLDQWREDRVAKIYKNGNFTLEGDSYRQQYKPNRLWRGVGKEEPWAAYPTGSGSWDRVTVYLWDDLNDEVIRAGMLKASNNRRWHEIRRRVDRLNPNIIPAETLFNLERALGIVRESS